MRNLAQDLFTRQFQQLSNAYLTTPSQAVQDQKLVVNCFNLQLGVVLSHLDIFKGKNCLQEAVDYRDRPFVAAELLSHLLEVKVPLHVVNGVVVFLSANFVDAEDLKLEV